ncbi:MAG: 3-deoxy-7-phosphoheptulonate synthase, partial [Oscillospiraceae bacterium]|nr:3-deoxy-7-phosphoheptulonate synthase [Oscillospiraceae bacterium]
MIIILKQGTQAEDTEVLRKNIAARGIIVQDIVGETTSMIGLAGDTSAISEDEFARYPCVERIIRVKEAYKLAGRKFHPEDSVF